MASLHCIASVKNLAAVLVVCSTMLFASGANAAQSPTVTTYKDAQGWKLKVDGDDFYVKGVVWDYKPVGANYSYNLYGQPDEFIKNLIDHEFSLMKAAGVTASRSFVRVPPKWVQYIYETYGIMTVVNPLMGRYGVQLGSNWVPFTDYSDPATRELLKAEVLGFVEMYKGVPGVLMIALGNESNYGLSWSSFEIENLPVDEQNHEKARFLYSLFNEVIQAARVIDPDRLFTVVNGDIQYLDLIAEYGKDWDLLGVNAYRGISFDNPADNNFLWARVKQQLDLPIVLMEFGSDAFNARDFAEDEAAQASYLRGQWQEIYNKSYGNGAEGNALGGFVFEWRDEWWKHKQTENLDTQDRTASWANGGYKFDFVEGQNNMNEEWFGINRIGELNDQGVYRADPRMAYDVLAAIWRTDPYAAGQDNVNAAIRDVDMEFYSLKSDIRALKSAKKENDKFRLTGGSFKGEMMVNGFSQELSEEGEDGLSFGDGQMLNLDFEFQPTSRIKGDFTINLLANVIESDFEFRYGDRGKTITVEKQEDGSFGVKRSPEDLEGRERIELYDFQASYTSNDFDLLAFYHVPRFHWVHEGDFYGLLRETTDMEGQDVWNSKAPYGIEFAGKDEMDGLKILAGPEIYWGANPKYMVKYDFGADDNYTFIYSDDISRNEESSSAGAATAPLARQATIYGKNEFNNGIKLEWGGIIAGTEKIDDSYDRLEGSDIVVDQITFEDTLGMKAKLEFDVGSNRAYVAMNYAGLVADGGDQLREFNTQLPYSALGNKQEVEAGFRFYSEPYMIYPRVLARKNLVDANPNIAPSSSGTTLFPGIDSRNHEDDAFAVLDNREANSVELYFTYDPTPGTWFYDWDIDMKEDADLAFNIGITATSYETGTDAHTYTPDGGGANQIFDAGLVKEDVVLLKSKWIINNSAELKSIYNLSAGTKQTTGGPGFEAIDFFTIDGKWILDKKDIYSVAIKVDDFGPYDFYRQFNLVYPLQLNLGYAHLLDNLGDELRSSKFGVKFFYRELGELSPEEEYQDGANDYMLEVQTYFDLRF